MILMVLRFLLVFFIGKTFYDLASYHDKNKWLYAFIGLVSYFVAAIVFALFAFLFIDAMGSSPLNANQLHLSMISVAVGLLSCWCVYKYLYSRWKNQNKSEHTEILDQDLI